MKRALVLSGLLFACTTTTQKAEPTTTTTKTAASPVLLRPGLLEHEPFDVAAVNAGVVVVANDSGAAVFGADDGRWRRDVAAGVFVAVAVSNNGRFVAGLAEDGRVVVVAVDDAGAAGWRRAPPAIKELQAPTLAVANDGAVVVADVDGFWVARAGSSAPARVALACRSARARADSVVCVAGASVALHHLDGSIALQQPIVADMSFVAVAPDGASLALLVGDEKQRRLRLQRGDDVVWERAIDAERLQFVDDGLVALGGEVSVVVDLDDGHSARAYTCRASVVASDGSVGVSDDGVCGAAPVLPWSAPAPIFAVEDADGRFLVGNRAVSKGGVVVARYEFSCDGFSDRCFERVIDGHGDGKPVVPLAFDGDGLLALIGAQVVRYAAGAAPRAVDLRPFRDVTACRAAGQPARIYAFDKSGVVVADAAGVVHWRRDGATGVAFSRDCLLAALELGDDVVVVDVDGVDRSPVQRMHGSGVVLAVSDSGAHVLVDDDDGRRVVDVRVGSSARVDEFAAPAFVSEAVPWSHEPYEAGVPWSLSATMTTPQGEVSSRGWFSALPRRDRLLLRFDNGVVADLGPLSAPVVHAVRRVEAIRSLRPANRAVVACTGDGGFTVGDDVVSAVDFDTCDLAIGRALSGNVRLDSGCVDGIDECVGGDHAVLSRDGAHVAAVSDDVLLTWDVAQRRVRNGVARHGARPLAIDAHRTWLVDDDNKVMIIDDKGASPWSVAVEDVSVGAVAPDGVFAFVDNGVVVVVGVDGVVRWRRPFPADAATALVFSDDSQQLWVGTRRGGVYRFEVAALR